MRVGVHISISGGFKNIIERAKQRGCTTIQIFSRNPRGWSPPKLTSSLKDVEKFQKELASADITPLILHLPYLPNLASPKEELYLKSIDFLISDLKQAEILNAPYLISHMGSHGGAGEKIGVEKMIKAINTSFSAIENDVLLLLENMAGEKNELGYNFKHIREVIEGVEKKERVGICLDTAHAFEAGFDISNMEGLEKTLNLIDKEIGLDRLKVLHINDSKTPCGSKVDRHTHIGEGYIQKKGFKNIINHPQLKGLPMILETPVMEPDDDIRNIKALKDLLI